ncbi:hypothetical protein [Streptomyces sp. NPDC088246]|uniref:hypothetical protein n=1 Tax=Streptomyces sp. NPDC088246 TaxID=3365842 RepID=UPI003828D8E9
MDGSSMVRPWWTVWCELPAPSGWDRVVGGPVTVGPGGGPGTASGPGALSRDVVDG